MHIVFMPPDIALMLSKNVLYSDYIKNFIVML